MNAPRWREGVAHLGPDVEPFLKSLLATGDRSLIYIAGAGFDPRSGHLAEIISATGVMRFGVFLREERPNPLEVLKQRGDASQARLEAAFPDSVVETVNIFEDHIPVAGLKAVEKIRKHVTTPGRLKAVTDVIVDLSALSIGVSFPIVGLLFEAIEDGGLEVNLHVVAATGGPAIEAAIVAEQAESYQNPTGFKGDLPPGGESPKRLWIPQLSGPKHAAYRELFKELAPDETCPVFPFPSRDPRGVEALLNEFTREIVDEWAVEPRQMLYAAEDDPLDLYRTLARIHLARTDIYERAGEVSQTVLSPIGSKAMAIGALLAAIEYKLPVAYVEARRYKPPSGNFVEDPDPAGFVHVWMLGEVYPD